MVAAAGLSRRSVKTHKLLPFDPEEKPIGVQLFGRRVQDFARAVETVSAMGFDFVDLNAGCPVKKVVSSGSVSALLSYIPLLTAIVRSMVKNTRLPVTVKIRLGWSPEEPVPGSLPRLLADEGVQALAVHGRYRSDMFSGSADARGIGRIVEASPIPVVANGDVRTFRNARELRSISGASGIMVGRGAMGNPWIFRSISRGRDDLDPSPDEVLEVIRTQYAMMAEYVPPRHLHSVFRGRLLQYIRGFPGASELRARATSVDSGEDLEDILSNLHKHLSEEEGS